MAIDVNDQLRIIAWPATPLPLPKAVKVESRLDREEGVIVSRARGPLGKRHYFTEQVVLSGETYLRLAEVDLDDPEEIFAFASTYGVLGGIDAYTTLTSTLTSGEDYLLAKVYEEQLDRLHEYGKKKRALWKEVRRVDANLPELESFEELPDDLELEILSVPSNIETLDEFRFAARCLGDLTSAWLMWRNDLEPSDIEWLSPGRLDLFLDRDGPMATLRAMLPQFLRFFSPHLDFEWLIEPEPEESANGVTVEPQRGPTDVPLYAICALELFNHIIENAEYRRCANENCQRTFVHQQGRAEKGQRRSRGVLYCTPACARATAQREYRRRRRRKSEQS